MEIFFATKKLQKELENLNTLKKAFGTNAKRISKRLDDIRASRNLATLVLLQGANCHLLIGNKKGQWAIQISGNLRLTFRIHNTPIPLLPNGAIDLEQITEIEIINIIDYH
ncbi:killer suppression protein HigA [Arachidicoccus ginsenosidivorans]|jgi:proteic killer suppression protein|uniref:Killer suppression protein HigA n=1 Tax=Arachidicoccus ginsenosidivorans TaxID=496057 RepID=A0A5B8VK04_9BACT|nr:type II toxin-antitoxin system RelE/ParE family toxin [Arachidicoccus ginsenosidivorans]QEC70956.1 killer suppression protein HigA [Arachidicoccus ginsenosidivorans]